MKYKKSFFLSFFLFEQKINCSFNFKEKLNKILNSSLKYSKEHPKIIGGSALALLGLIYVARKYYFNKLNDNNKYPFNKKLPFFLQENIKNKQQYEQEKYEQEQLQINEKNEYENFKKEIEETVEKNILFLINKFNNIDKKEEKTYKTIMVFDENNKFKLIQLINEKRLEQVNKTYLIEFIENKYTSLRHAILFFKIKLLKNPSFDDLILKEQNDKSKYYNLLKIEI